MKTKAQYKVKNWNAYDAALKQRGSITFACERRSNRAVAQSAENGEKGSIEYGYKLNHYADLAKYSLKGNK
jgi:hypothetical protein